MFTWKRPRNVWTSAARRVEMRKQSGRRLKTDGRLQKTRSLFARDGAGRKPAGYFLAQSRRWRELGMPIFFRYLVTVRRATFMPSFFKRLTISSSL